MILKDRVAIITGASSGIGAATAQAFGRAGMRVALFARRADRLEQVATEVHAAGGQAIVVPGDIRDRGTIIELVDRTLAEFGQIDVLFNNAGLGRLGWLETLDPADVRLQLDVNLLGLIDLTQVALPHMLHRRSGHIINMASLAGKIGTPTYTVYAATKFGVAGFSEALRREVAPWGVHVSALYPGGVATEWGQQVGYRRRSALAFARRVRMPAGDVARAVVALVKRPRREVILPPAARVLVGFNRIAPWLADWVTRRFVSAERRIDALS
ncbi:MAG TPA: SDR family oxidoreductase [Anaerolineae bacterium]|nr:SDR family oxidoreductase [Anaerolineae bacterium]